jgi:calcineurin-like phosphoesterase family protein
MASVGLSALGLSSNAQAATMVDGVPVVSSSASDFELTKFGKEIQNGKNYIENVNFGQATEPVDQFYHSMAKEMIETMRGARNKYSGYANVYPNVGLDLGNTDANLDGVKTMWDTYLVDGLDDYQTIMNRGKDIFLQMNPGVDYDNLTKEQIYQLRNVIKMEFAKEISKGMLRTINPQKGQVDYSSLKHEDKIVIAVTRMIVGLSVLDAAFKQMDENERQATFNKSFRTTDYSKERYEQPSFTHYSGSIAMPKIIDNSSIIVNQILKQNNLPYDQKFLAQYNQTDGAMAFLSKTASEVSQSLAANEGGLKMLSNSNNAYQIVIINGQRQ